MSLFFLLLASLALPPSTEADSSSHLAHSLFSEDLFLTHLKSDFVNHSISPCDNLYRRVCPKDFVKSEELFVKLTAQVEAVERIRSFADASPVDHTIQRLWTTWDSVDTQRSLTDEKFVKNELKDASASSLISLFRTLSIVNKKEGNDAIIDALMHDEMHSGDYAHITEQFVESDRDRAISSLAVVVATAVTRLDHPRRLVANFTRKLEDEVGVLELLKSSDIDTGRAMRRVEDVIESLLEVYADKYESASWAAREGRFGYETRHLLRNFLKEIHFGVFFAARFSLASGIQRAVLDKYNEVFLAEYRAMSDIGRLPRLRLLHAGMTALGASLRSRSGLIRTRLLGPPRVPEITALWWMENHVKEFGVIANQLLATHVAITAKTPTLYAFVGLTLAHELYHQHQFAMLDFVEDDTEHLMAKSCVRAMNSLVCARMVEKTCSAGELTSSENTADAYGVQIAHEAYLKREGRRSQMLAYPSLPLTNHELFFYSLAVANCRVYEKTQWPTDVQGDIIRMGDHNGEAYRVPAMVAQVPAFKDVFACYDNEAMIFPEKARCPVLSDRFA